MLCLKQCSAIDYVMPANTCSAVDFPVVSTNKCSAKDCHLEDVIVADRKDAATIDAALKQLA